VSSFTFCKTLKNVIVKFLSFYLLTHLKNTIKKFLDEGCEKESEMKTKGKTKGEGSKEIPSFQFKNHHTMQLIMKKLHEQRLNWKPHGKNSPTWAFFVSMMNY
jgi:hypothetical protein